MSKLPTHVTVLGAEFTVSQEKIGEGIWGECDMQKRILRIDPDQPDPMSTLFHEVTHAAFAISGWAKELGEEREEALTQMLEHALGPFFRVP